MTSSVKVTGFSALSVSLMSQIPLSAQLQERLQGTCLTHHIVVFRAVLEDFELELAFWLS